jgi:hypothetical protein
MSDTGDTVLRVPLPRRPGRFDWLHASWLVTCSIAGFVALFFLPLDTALWARFMLALGIGATSAIALQRFMQLLFDERLWRMVRHLPRSIQIERQTDGSMIAFVERLDGEPRLVTLPEGYDPNDDEGRHLFELLGVRLP